MKSIKSISVLMLLLALLMVNNQQIYSQSFMKYKIWASEKHIDPGVYFVRISDRVQRFVKY